jgi:ribosome-binding factor A
MATTRRMSRVAELIKREISQMILFELKDDRVGAGMISITDVDLSGDLQHAKIFVSIYGNDEARELTMAALHSATGYIRRSLGKRIQLRRTPELIFEEDLSLARGTEMLTLLTRIEEERPAHLEDLDNIAPDPNAEIPTAEAEDDDD